MNKFCRFSTGLFFLSVEKLFQVCKGSDPLLRQLTVSCLVDMKPLRQLPLKALRGGRRSAMYTEQQRFPSTNQWKHTVNRVL